VKGVMESFEIHAIVILFSESTQAGTGGAGVA
jgi:hypothetical protein